MQKIKEFQVLLLAVILGLSFIVCSKIFASNFSNSGITVTGQANSVVVSDNASWNFEISVQNASKSAAYTEIQKQLPLVLSYLKENGIQESEVRILAPNSYPTYKTDPKTGYGTQNIAYYNYSQPLKVQSSDVNKIQALSVDIQGLIQKGINISATQPEYYYSKLNEVKAQLLEEATKDAKARAKGMLSATNNRVGKIRSVKMGVFQITPKDSNAVSDWGINDNTTIDKKVTAVANVVFQIK